jgi:hypothetical protein
MAEGVVTEPFLPSGDQGRKGGFATLPKQRPITCGITNEIPHENEPFPSGPGRKIWCELGNTQKLGVLPNQTQQPILVKNSRIGRGLELIRSPGRFTFYSKTVTQSWKFLP